MKVAVVWIDREHAKIFLLSEEKMERLSFNGRHKEHHTHLRDSLDKEREEHGFFRKITAPLESADRMLIIGPGIAKHHFQNFLREEKPLLAKKVASVETVDHPTDGQIADIARHFFKKEPA